MDQTALRRHNRGFGNNSRSATGSFAGSARGGRRAGSSRSPQTAPSSQPAAPLPQHPAAAPAPPAAGPAQVLPAPGRRPQPVEPLPFAETLVFTRKGAELRTTPYPMSEVRLLDGPCKQAEDYNRGYMMRIAPERLLHTFRLNAGLASSAEALGGWEAPRGELRGHTTGHYLSACALRAASAGDTETKARGDEMVAELARCQNKLASGGYLSAFPLEFFDRLDKGKNVWAPFYTYHKILAGMLDMYFMPA